jgi:lambda family phage portal protein
VTKRRRPGYIRSVLQSILSPVATTLSGFMGGGYNVLDPRRKIIDRGQMFANKATANQLLNGGLSQIRTYCRHLERNNPTAQAAVLALDALVIGSGIDLEPDTGDDATNGLVRKIFYDWMRSVAVDGSDIYQLQHTAMRECPVAGEWVWRVIPGGDGPIALRVLPLEGEWLSDAEGASPANGCTMAAGVELDRYGSPVAYFLVPPEGGKPEKVSAASIIHGFEKKRSLQARGEPWFTPVIETLMNERDLVDVELKAATVTANIGLAIESEYHERVDTTEHGDSDDPVQALGLGSVVRLYPGEKVNAFHHTRPSQQIAPFRQMLRGDIAAALRIPQRFLDRDVSRANYSSMRADMLDTQRLLQPIREMVGHKTIGALYRIAAPYISAMLGVAIDPTRYRLLPDGQPYVDPVKDINAATAAIAAGLSTHEAEIGARGGDYRQVWAQLAKEQAEMAALGITMSQPGPTAAPSKPNKPEDDDEDDKKTKEKPEDDTVRTADLERIVSAVRDSQRPAPIAAAQPFQVINRAEIDTDSAAAMGRAIGESMRPTVVNVPQQPPPVVNVAAPEVRIEQAAQAAPSVTVNVPQQAPATVTVSPTPVNIENQVIIPSRTVIAEPIGGGRVKMTPQD